MAFPSRAKSRVDERRPIAFKTRFFDFRHRGKRKNTLGIAIPRRRFHTIILSFFQAGKKALTNVVQLRSKRVFSTFPIGETKKHPWDRIPRRRFHTTILSGLFQAGQKAGLTNVVHVAFKTPAFCPAWRKPTQTPLVEIQPTSWNSIPRVFFRFAPMGKVEKTLFERNWTTFVNPAFFPAWKSLLKHPWDRIPRGRFHTIILSMLFQAGKKAGLTNVVQLRSKRVFLTFPIGAKRKNTVGIEIHDVGFIPPF